MKGLRLWFAWLLVGVPLAWGVTRSVQKALPLFKVSPDLRTSSTTTNPPTP
jgi:hypothetical protein